LFANSDVARRKKETKGFCPPSDGFCLGFSTSGWRVYEGFFEGKAGPMLGTKRALEIIARGLGVWGGFAGSFPQGAEGVGEKRYFTPNPAF